jgi:hypothetical protein
VPQGDPTVEDAPPQGVPPELILVTTAIAQAGFLFTMYKSERFGITWELRFNMTDGSQVDVEVQSTKDYVTVIASPGIGTVDPEAAFKLLDLNGRLLLARAGLDIKKEVIILSQFPRVALSPAQIKQSVQAVLNAVMDSRVLLRPAPVSSP